MSESLVVGWYRADVAAALVARAGAVVALTGSAAVHATVIGEHLDEWAVAGSFFIVVTLVELFLALAVIAAWSQLTAIAVVVTSIGTVGVWLVSRTVGLPFGPAELRAAEAVGAPDLACCVLEVAAAALTAPWAFRRWSQRRPPPGGFGGFGRAGTTAAVVLAGVLGAVAVWGLVSSLSGTGTATMSAPSCAGATPQGAACRCADLPRCARPGARTTASEWELGASPVGRSRLSGGPEG